MIISPEKLQAAVDRPLKVDASRRTPTEHEEQRAVVEWFRKSFNDVRIFAIPNGGRRSKTEALKLKVEGVSAGVPDLFIPELLLWVEMKRRKGGKVSEEQESWIDYLSSIGHDAIVCRGADEAKKMILDKIKSPI